MLNLVVRKISICCLSNSAIAIVVLVRWLQSYEKIAYQPRKKVCKNSKTTICTLLRIITLALRWFLGFLNFYFSKKSVSRHAANHRFTPTKP